MSMSPLQGLRIATSTTQGGAKRSAPGFNMPGRWPEESSFNSRALGVSRSARLLRKPSCQDAQAASKIHVNSTSLCWRRRRRGDLPLSRMLARGGAGLLADGDLRPLPDVPACPFRGLHGRGGPRAPRHGRRPPACCRARRSPLVGRARRGNRRARLGGHRRGAPVTLPHWFYLGKKSCQGWHKRQR